MPNRVILLAPFRVNATLPPPPPMRVAACQAPPTQPRAPLHVRLATIALLSGLAVVTGVLIGLAA